MAEDINAEGDGLRWHQWLIVQRALEYNEDGNLCWPLVLITMPRQQGKTVLLAELALWRAAHAHLWGERQRVLHAARNAGLANEVQAACRLWAGDAGLDVKRRMGDSYISFPDGSHWHVRALKAVYGQRVSLALLDEGWDMQPESFWQGLWPAMSERTSRQAWVFSAANGGDRGLIRSMAAAPGTLVIAWGAPKDADYTDERIWDLATPHMTPNRLDAMRTASATVGFEMEWLNVWPFAEEEMMGWPPHLNNCKQTIGSPAEGCLGAIEVSQDRARYGYAVAWPEPDGRISALTGTATSLPDAIKALEAWEPSMVFVGLSLRESPLWPWHVQGVGMKETKEATPILELRIRNGMLSHDHNAMLMQEALAARVTEVESGMVLSARRSVGPVPTLKALCWATWAVDSGKFQIASNIW